MGEFITNLECAHCGNKEFLKTTEALLQCTGCKKYKYNPEAVKKEGKPNGDMPQE